MKELFLLLTWVNIRMTNPKPGNRKRFCEATGIMRERLFVPYQTHETNLLDIDPHFLSLSSIQQKEGLLGIDALVTAEPGVCIAVTTADCVPILLYAPDRNVVAAIHAGWRGTVAGIAGKTASYLCSAYNCDPGLLQVAIGPCISANIFEVGSEVVQAFTDIIVDIPGVAFVHPDSGKVHLDLAGINAGLLRQVGVRSENMELSGICTYSDDSFFSARRQGISSGRMLTGIMIKN